MVRSGPACTAPLSFGPFSILAGFGFFKLLFEDWKNFRPINQLALCHLLYELVLTSIDIQMLDQHSLLIMCWIGDFCLENVVFMPSSCSGFLVCLVVHPHDDVVEIIC